MQKGYSFGQRLASFWAKVNKNGPTPPHHPEMSNCWLWEGSTTDGRYGQWYMGEDFGNRQAHIVAFMLMNGRLPNGDIDHLCHVTMCVRYEHLREATHQENCRNRANKLCKRGHPLADPNLYYYKSNGVQKRRCLTCIQAEFKSRVRV